VFEHPRAGVSSRLAVIESQVTTLGEPVGVGLSWVTVRLQTSVEYQNHPLTLPIRLVAISFQPREVCR